MDTIDLEPGGRDAGRTGLETTLITIDLAVCVA